MRAICCLVISALLVLGEKSVCAEVRVSGLSARQRPGTGLFDIRYDLVADAEYVAVDLSVFDGESSVSVASARGDLGSKVKAEIGRAVVWDAQTDYGIARLSTNLVVALGVSALRPEGGDPRANDWLEFDDRWIRNHYADGSYTVSDLESGVMWTYDAASKGTAPWREALAYCEQLSYAGYSDWKLPDKKQLVSLFPFIHYFRDVQPERYWSSQPNYSYADSVNMADGRAKYDYPSKGRWIWPCRDIPESLESRDRGDLVIASISPVFLDTYTFQVDYDRNGVADMFDDRDGDGRIDALCDFNGNGQPDLLEDFNKNGLPDALEDVNQNKIPDAFEDANRNGISDGFEDVNGNGIPDSFEAKFPLVGYDADQQAFGPMRLKVYATDRLDEPLDADRIYHGEKFRIDWSDFLANSSDDFSGFVYRVDQDPAGELGLKNGAYVGRNSHPYVEVKLRGDGCYYVHVAPVLAREFKVAPQLHSVAMIRRDSRAPRIHSVTHPDASRWYASRQLSLEFLPVHLDCKSVKQFYYEWDRHPDTVPDLLSTPLVGFKTAYSSLEDGVYYFHLRSEDFSGALSATSHYAVRVGKRPKPAPDFIVDRTEGVAPLTVQFVDQSQNEVNAYVWDLNGDGVMDSSQKNPMFAYHKPGVYSVKLTLIGPGGVAFKEKAGLITVHP
jgi:hypothetical protein